MMDEMWGEKDIRRSEEIWGGDEMWMGMRWMRFGRNDINEIWKMEVNEIWKEMR